MQAWTDHEDEQQLDLHARLEQIRRYIELIEDTSQSTFSIEQDQQANVAVNKDFQASSPKPNPTAIHDLKVAYRNWRERTNGKVSEILQFLKWPEYNLVTVRTASLSGLEHYPASDRLIAGDVLFVTYDAQHKSLSFWSELGEPVGYTSGNRGYAQYSIDAIKHNSTIYGLVEGRGGGKTGTRNRVHVILIEAKPRRPKPAETKTSNDTKPLATQLEHSPTENFDEQEAVLEEEANLASIHSAVNTFISEKRAAIQRIEDDYRDYHPVDTEGRAIRNADMRESESKRRKIEQYESYLDSPYFAHIDVLDDDDEPYKALIGIEPIEIRGDQLVIDWRSEMADVYYNKQNLRPVVKGKPYTLMLRRTVTIENAMLQAVVTEYDSTSGEAPSEIVDEFLLSVLRDKRRQYKLTDIIKTIQQNQNEILRYPADQSFIVQGCAGSGKTMVLLHRLSYLASNEPNVDFSRYVVVTPSDSFNDYLDGLNVRLELDRISKYSVESYYTHLIKRLSYADVYTSQTGGRRSNAFKVTIPNSIELYEDLLGEDLLKRIYSISFLDEVSTLVSKTKQDALNKMASAGVSATFKEQGMSTPLPTDTPFAIHGILAANERKIRESLSSVQKELEEAIREYDMAEEALEGELNRVEHANSLLGPASELLVSTCQKRINDIDTAIEQVRLPIEADEQRLHTLENTLAQKNSDLDKLNDLISTLEANGNGVVKPHVLLFGDSLVSTELAEIFAERVPRIKELHEQEIADEQAKQELARASESITTFREWMLEIEAFEQSGESIRSLISGNGAAALALRSRCKREIATIDELESERDALSVLAFGRRRRLNEDIESAERSLEAAALKALDELKSYQASQVEAQQRAIDALTQSLEAHMNVETELSAIDQEILNVIAEELDNLRIMADAQKRDCEQLEADIAEMKSATFNAHSEIKALSSEKKRLTNIVNSAKEDDYPDYSRLIPFPNKEINDALSHYQEIRQQFKQKELELLSSASERISFLRKRNDDLQAKVDETKRRLDESIHSTKIDIIQGLVSDLDVRSLVTQLETHIGNIYAKYGKTFDKNIFYRHRLFALLALCGSYYKMRNQRERYVCIDEAQDLSPAEYSLLHSILDDGTVFNLYGDTAQLVCEYRGINAWSEIADTITDTIFELNENYRNTLQITEFCNQELSHNMTGVGLTGADVQKLPFKNAITKVLAIKAANSAARIAIIHKRGFGGLDAYFDSSLMPNFSWGLFDPERISIIDVETSKGLEFEAAVVIESYMSDNERYISYTRALDNLFIATISSLSSVESISITSSSHADEHNSEE